MPDNIFADLIPAANPFADLIPKQEEAPDTNEDQDTSTAPAVNQDAFKDLIPAGAEAPKPAGRLEGVINSFRQAWKSANLAGDVKSLDESLRTQGPTLGQERRAFVRAMEDPRYNAATLDTGDQGEAVRLLGGKVVADPDAPAVKSRMAERMQALYGPKAKLEEMRRGIEQGQQFEAGDIVRQQQELAAVPMSEVAQEWNQAKGVDAAKLFTKSPANALEITANIVASGMGSSAKTLVKSMAGGVVAGPAGAALGAGLGSYSVESASSIVDSIQKVDPDALQDPTKLLDMLNSKEKMAEFRAHAFKRGVPIALLDGVSAAIAGRFLHPVLGQGLMKVGAASVKEATTQALLGAGGEAAGQVASGEPLDFKAMFEEGVGELGPGVGEVITNLRGEAKTQKAGRLEAALQAPAQALEADHAATAAAQAQTPETDATLERQFLDGEITEEEFKAAQGTDLKPLEADLAATMATLQPETATATAPAVVQAEAAPLTIVPPPEQVKVTAPPAIIPAVEAEPLATDAQRAVTVMPIADIHADPDRFQYKVIKGEAGNTGSLKDVKAYDHNLAGILLVWKDPQDGKTYVVNGHNRVFKARQLGETEHAVRYLDVGTAEEARVIGALANIAEGHGNALDAAKLFRDTGMDQVQMESRGLQLTKGMVTDALGLASLNQPLFDKIAKGQFPIERGIIIGQRLPNHADQAALVELINRAERGGQAINNATIAQLADQVREAPRIEQQAEGMSLFAQTPAELNLAVTKAEVQSYVAREYSRTKNIFGAVAIHKRANVLTQAGNSIDVEGNKQRATVAAQDLEIFNRLKNRTELANILNSAAVKIGKGENERSAKAEAFRLITEKISDLIKRGDGSSSQSDQGGSSPGQPEAGARSSAQAGAAKSESLALSESSPAYREQLDLGIALPGQPGMAGQDPAGTISPATRPAPNLDIDFGNPGDKLKYNRDHPLIHLFDPVKFAEVAFKAGNRISSLVHKLVNGAIPAFDIVGKVVNSAEDFAMLLLPLRSPQFETFKVAILNDKNEVVHSQVLTAGNLDTTIMDFPRLLNSFQKMKKRGKRVMFAHNHPGGDPNPSEADRRVTVMMENLAREVGFEMVDHVITDGQKFYSLKADREQELKNPALAKWETVPRLELHTVQSDTALKAVVKSLRAVSQDHVHVIYLNTRMRVTAVERIPRKNLTKKTGNFLTTPGQMGINLKKHILEGVAIETPKYIIIDMPPGTPLGDGMAIAGPSQKILPKLQVHLLDFTGDDNGTLVSARAEGYINSANQENAYIAEQVQTAALRIEGQVFTGPSHPMALMAAIGSGRLTEAALDKAVEAGKVEDGFITDDGRFISRDEAFDIADRNSQLDPKAYNQPATQLQSENVFPAMQEPSPSYTTGTPAPTEDNVRRAVAKLGADPKEFIATSAKPLPNNHTLYFDMLEPGSASVPVSVIHYDTPQSGPLTSAKYLLRSMVDGRRMKREPVRIRRTVDGRFIALDGNAILHALKLEGVENAQVLPVEIETQDPETGKISTTRIEDVRNDLAARRQLAEASMGMFENVMMQFRASLPFNVQWRNPGVKGFNRSFEKSLFDYKGDAGLVKDLLRGTFTVATLAEAQETATALQKFLQERNILTGKSRITFGQTTEDGYQDAKFNFFVNGDLVAEAQVNVDSIAAAKRMAHGAYEERTKIERTIALTRGETTTQRARIIELNTSMRAIYGQAWADVMARERPPTFAQSEDQSDNTLGEGAPATGPPSIPLTPEEQAAVMAKHGIEPGELMAALAKPLPQGVGNYFETRGYQGARAVPIGALGSLKENGPKALAAAKYFMRQSYEGKGPKRKPISVRVNENGSLLVLDGNATTRVAQMEGLEHVQVIAEEVVKDGQVQKLETPVQRIEALDEAEKKNYGDQRETVLRDLPLKAAMTSLNSSMDRGLEPLRETAEQSNMPGANPPYSTQKYPPPGVGIRATGTPSTSYSNEPAGSLSRGGGINFIQENSMDLFGGVKPNSTGKPTQEERAKLDRMARARWANTQINALQKVAKQKGLTAAGRAQLEGLQRDLGQTDMALGTPQRDPAEVDAERQRAEQADTIAQRQARRLVSGKVETQNDLFGAPGQQSLFEPAPIYQAKGQVKEAYSAFYKMGLVANPKADAEKVLNFYKALYNLAKAYIAQGLKDFKQFAARVGVDSDIAGQAWADAQAGKMASSLDPALVNQTTADFKQRKFSKRLNDDPRIAGPIRASTGNRDYQVIPNQLTVAEAMTLLDKIGRDTAMLMVQDEQNPMPPRVRVTLGQALIQKFNWDYNRAIANTDQAAANLALDNSVKVAEFLTELGTKLGQGVQAFAIWSNLTPQGYVAAYKRAINASNPKARNGQAPGINLSRNQQVKYDPAVAKEIARRAQAALRKPAGFQRDEAVMGVLQYIAQQKGFSLWDIGTALWYANILSGVTTQAINLASTVANVMAEAANHVAIHPSAIGDVAIGLYQGTIRGAWDAFNVMRTGKITGTRVQKLDQPRVLEMINFKGPAAPLNAWKYVFRTMAAADMLNFRAAEEMRARFLARSLARDQKLSGAALTAEMARILHDSDIDKAQATMTAKLEGLDGMAALRRIAEIMQQQRPPDLVQDAADFGRFATFNQEPQGVLGAIAKGINYITGGVPGLRFIVPFTHIVANVTNNALNFTPWGFKRLFAGYWGGDLTGAEAPAYGSDNFKLQAARAVLGTLGLVALGLMAGKHRDDEDPEFMITAKGPADLNHQKQLKEMGWKPYSVKIGSRYISYLYSPLGVGLAVVGNWMDAIRYRKLEEQDLGVRLAYGMQSAGTMVLSQSFLVGLSDFLGSLQQDRINKTGVPMAGLSRTASSVVIPNLVKQVDRVFDPTIYQATSIQAALVRDLPIARGNLDPIVNVLGDPVRYDQNKFFGTQKGDDVWQMIADKQAWISTPNKTMMIGDRAITPEEYYDFTIRSGQAIKGRLSAGIMRLQNLAPEKAQEEVGKIVSQERAKAKRELFGNVQKPKKN